MQNNTRTFNAQNMNELTLYSPIKINRFLRIIGRRNDGYHLLQTAFQFVDWWDKLHFRVIEGGGVRHLRPIPGVKTEDDLILRAAHLLQRLSGTRLGVEIEITKHLPMGAGLGGGSSNAATTLLALNYLWQLNFSLDDLAEIGLRLGADVPVFIRGKSAWGEGVGEVLTPMEFDTPWILIVIPPVQISTHQIFSDPSLPRQSPAVTPREFAEVDGLNDCSEVVCRQYPQVKAAMQQLNSFVSARLTGTGCAIYGLFDDESSANAAQVALQSNFVTHLGKVSNHSLLHSQLDWL